MCQRWIHYVLSSEPGQVAFAGETLTVILPGLGTSVRVHSFEWQESLPTDIA